jgi:hypothetical protein
MTFAEIRQQLNADRLAVWDQLISHGPRTVAELSDACQLSHEETARTLAELNAMFHVARIKRTKGGEALFRARSTAEAAEAHAAIPSDAKTEANGDRRGTAYYIPAPDPDSFPSKPAHQTGFLFE